MKNLTNNKISKLLKEEVKASRDAVSTNWRLMLKGEFKLEHFTSWLEFEVKCLQDDIIYVSNRLKKSRRKDFLEISDLATEILAQISASNVLNPKSLHSMDTAGYCELTRELIRTIRAIALEIRQYARYNAYRRK